MAHCAERARLEEAVRASLGNIIEHTRRIRKQLGIDMSGIETLDKALERAVGEKERAFGALAQHKKDHGC